jgi:hypothetical protein
MFNFPTTRYRQFGGTVFSITVFIAFLCVAAPSNSAYGQQVRLRSQVVPNCTVVSGSTRAKFADIYADGNIAVQGSYNCRGVFIYDISNLDAPVLASVYDPSPRQAFLEAIVIGNRGYFGSGGTSPSGTPSVGDGVHIVDLTDPYQPVLLGKVNSTNGGGFNGIHEMLVHENFLIENYNSTSNKTIRIIDISNPASPVLKWSMTPIDATWVHNMHIRGNRMYTSGWGGRIEIYDISNLATQAPVLLGSVVGNSTNHSSWTSEDGRYLYSCRETLDGDLRIYDVQNPAQPFLVRSIKTSELGLNAVSPHNPTVLGNYLYISWYQAGVQVFDLSNPTNPKRVAQFDTYEAAFAPEGPELERLQKQQDEPWDLYCGSPLRQSSLPTSYDGNWAVFPFLGHDRIIAGDMTNGLLVLDASRVANPKNQNSDFDGDGKTDRSIYRPTTGNWTYEASEDGRQFTVPFGNSTDIIAPGDYDGDGKTDIAVYRPSAGTWFVNRSRDGFLAFSWGLSTDIPVPADYDADGKTDFAVFRPSNGVWYISQSLKGIKIVSWGLGSDKPVAGDFDGDGKADIAVWRPSNGLWYVIQSTSSIPFVWNFGMTGDKPILADFDGNGRTDFAVFRPSTGTFFISDPAVIPIYRVINWGSSSDIPVPSDFDGDGKSDVAVFRPSTNQWFIINSADGSIRVESFGAGGDVPSPAALNPQ